MSIAAVAAGGGGDRMLQGSNEVCNCGMGGANCDVSLTSNPLSYPCVHGSCNINGTTPTCVCDCDTWGGADCSVYQVLRWNAIVCLVVTSAIIISLITWLSTRDAIRRVESRREWDRIPGIASFTGNSLLPNWRKLIVLFRGFFFVFALYVEVDNISTNGGGQFQFFTIWSYCLLIFYFGLGVIVAYRGIIRSEENRLDENAPLDPLERAHFAVFEILLPDTLFVDVVLWGILYPNAVMYNEENDKKNIACSKLSLCYI
jgi:hypothetical protein